VPPDFLDAFQPSRGINLNICLRERGCSLILAPCCPVAESLGLNDVVYISGSDENLWPEQARDATNSTAHAEYTPTVTCFVRSLWMCSLSRHLLLESARPRSPAS
jgi:hypothetical protein